MFQTVTCERQGSYSVDSRRKDKTEMTLTCMCVCSFLIMFVRAWFYWSFSVCLFIHLPFCLRICQSHCVLCASVLHLDSICRLFSVQRLFSSLLWLGKYSSVWIRVPALKPNYPSYCEISYTCTKCWCKSNSPPCAAHSLSHSLTHYLVFSFLHSFILSCIKESHRPAFVLH